jgi:hypothetical protein
MGKMKATQRHLDLYKKEILRWLNLFKISGWEFYFEFDEKDKENTAGSKWNLEGRTMIFELSRHQKRKYLTDESIKISALHEVLHVIFARLSTLASRRYTSETEIKESIEEVVTTLLNYFKTK